MVISPVLAAAGVPSVEGEVRSLQREQWRSRLPIGERAARALCSPTGASERTQHWQMARIMGRPAEHGSSGRA
jgi:hypothetical protein